MTRKQEILLNRKMRYHEVTEALKNQGLIPETANPEDYDICKVSSIIKFIVEDLPNEKWVPLNSNGGFTTLDGHPLFLRSDGYLILIRNRESFKSAPIIADEDVALPVGSIADSISSKYDKFDIKSSAHRIPYIGGGGYKQKGVTITVMDKTRQEEIEKKKQEEEEERKKLRGEDEDDEKDEITGDSGSTRPRKPKQQKPVAQPKPQVKNTAVGDDEEMVVADDVDLDFLYDLESA